MISLSQLSSYTNYFNWTMTYRRNSDIPIIYGWLTLKVTLPLSTSGLPHSCQRVAGPPPHQRCHLQPRGCPT